MTLSFDFESVLSATAARITSGGGGASGGPTIVSEDHNLGNIDWVRGLSDPGEMIGCGMYQQLRRLANETDADYSKRLRVELAAIPAADRMKIETAMKGAAIRRAGLDVSTGRVAVMAAGAAARKALWHRLGVQVAEAVSSDDAIRMASLNWRVEKVATGYTWGDKSYPMPDVFALVRSDTGAHLGTVGTRYQVIQNEEAFRFMDSVLAEHGAKYETAGAIYGGAKVWLQVSLPEAAFTLAGNDRVEATALFTNPHDGSGVARCIPTSDRVVCANTLRVATSKATDAGLKIRHTGSIRGKMDDARRALGIAVKGFETFREQADTLRATRVADPRGYFDGVLDAVLDLTAARAKLGAERLADADVLAGIIDGQEARDRAAKSYQRAIDDRGSALADILDRHERERSGLGGARGTAWGTLNAVTEHADHYISGRKVGTQEVRDGRRMESILTGERDQMKQVALTSGLALAN
jgi:phage/plasmid-like protein (TIGR03299 family)